MGVEPKIGVFGKPPKWMVKIMETPIKMDDLGAPLFLETPKSFSLSTPTIDHLKDRTISFCELQTP